MEIESLKKELKRDSRQNIERLAEKLESDDGKERIEAAWALSSISTPRVLGLLIDALEKEKDPFVGFLIACSIENVDFFDERLVLKLQKIAMATDFEPIRRSIEDFLNKALGATERVKLELIEKHLRDASAEDIRRLREEGLKVTVLQNIRQNVRENSLRKNVA